MIKYFILTLLLSFNGHAATLDKGLPITNIDCHKIVEIQPKANPNTNDLYAKTISKLTSIYYYIKYHIENIFYLFEAEAEVSQKVVNITDNQNLYNNDKNKTNKFIAHAGGNIGGKKYTNSLEALNKSYKNGFRLFELDILKTSDNVYVAAHSWQEWKSNTNYKGSTPPTLKDFKKIKLYNKYTSIDINDINQWFCSHKDAVLITDKVNEPTEFSNQFLFKKRLYMELFSISALLEGVNQGVNVMPTWRVLNTFGSRVVENLQDLNIKAVAASRRKIKKNKELLRKLKRNNIRVYAFHINEKGKDEAYVLCNEMDYFYGMYADKWDFDTILNCTKD